MKIELNIENIKIEVDHYLLESIVENMPDIKNNIKVYEKLARYSNPKVRDHIAKKEYINRKTIKILLDDKKDGIISSLLQNPNAAQQIKHQELLSIIEKGNLIHSIIILESLAYFEHLDKTIIQDKLKKHIDPNICHSFVSTFSSSKVSKEVFKYHFKRNPQLSEL